MGEKVDLIKIHLDNIDLSKPEKIKQNFKKVVNENPQSGYINSKDRAKFSRSKRLPKSGKELWKLVDFGTMLIAKRLEARLLTAKRTGSMT